MASVPTTQLSTAPATSGSFAERITFSKVYSLLEAKGVSLTTEDKKTFEEITLDELRRNNGQMMGNDLGNSFTNLVYLLFAFIQNIFKGTPGNLKEFGAHLANTGEDTLEQGKLNQLQQATIRIHMRLSAYGGNLARAANLATGQTPKHAQNLPTDLHDSIYGQLAPTIRFSGETSLNERMTPSQVPTARSDNPLTQDRPRG